MNKMVAPVNAKEASIGVVVIRKDGRIEDLGVVAYWHSSRWRRVLFHMKSALRKVLRWRLF